MKNKGVMGILQKSYIGIIFFLLYLPIMVMIVTSFNESRSAYIWGGFSLVKFQQLFSNNEVMDAVKNTLLLSVCAALLSTVIGTLACIGIMSLSRRLRNTALGAINIPLLNADIVTGVAFMMFFARYFGRLSFATVLISHVTITLPYVILNVMPKLQQLDESAYHAALDLGATPFYAYRRVVIPELWSDILTGFLFAFTLSFDDFTLTYYTAGAGIATISTNIYTNRTRGILPEYYALFSLMFVVALGILFFMNRKADSKAKYLI